jgi:hypothetical protein
MQCHVLSPNSPAMEPKFEDKVRSIGGEPVSRCVDLLLPKSQGNITGWIPTRPANVPGGSLQRWHERADQFLRDIALMKDIRSEIMFMREKRRTVAVAGTRHTGPCQRFNPRPRSPM